MVDRFLFDLRKETYRPYKKENDKLFYINTSSNHPRSIIKQIPTSVSHRLSDNFANEEIFNNAKTEYENALKTSGHTADLEFNPNLTHMFLYIINLDFDISFLKTVQILTKLQDQNAVSQETSELLNFILAATWVYMCAQKVLFNTGIKLMSRLILIFIYLIYDD